MCFFPEDLGHSLLVTLSDIIVSRSPRVVGCIFLSISRPVATILTVQGESSKNEIAFLSKEQDADKIKIGELENLVSSMCSIVPFRHLSSRNN